MEFEFGVSSPVDAGSNVVGVSWTAPSPDTDGNWLVATSESRVGIYSAADRSLINCWFTRPGPYNRFTVPAVQNRISRKIYSVQNGNRLFAWHESDGSLETAARMKLRGDVHALRTSRKMKSLAVIFVDGSVAFVNDAMQQVTHAEAEDDGTVVTWARFSAIPGHSDRFVLLVLKQPPLPVSGAAPVTAAAPHLLVYTVAVSTKEVKDKTAAATAGTGASSSSGAGASAGAAGKGTPGAGPQSARKGSTSAAAAAAGEDSGAGAAAGRREVESIDLKLGARHVLAHPAGAAAAGAGARVTAIAQHKTLRALSLVWSSGHLQVLQFPLSSGPGGGFASAPVQTQVRHLRRLTHTGSLASEDTGNAGASGSFHCAAFALEPYCLVLAGVDSVTDGSASASASASSAGGAAASHRQRLGLSVWDIRYGVVLAAKDVMPHDGGEPEMPPALALTLPTSHNSGKSSSSAGAAASSSAAAVDAKKGSSSSVATASAPSRARSASAASSASSRTAGSDGAGAAGASTTSPLLAALRSPTVAGSLAASAQAVSARELTLDSVLGVMVSDDASYVATVSRRSVLISDVAARGSGGLISAVGRMRATAPFLHAAPAAAPASGSAASVAAAVPMPSLAACIDMATDAAGAGAGSKASSTGAGGASTGAGLALAASLGFGGSLTLAELRRAAIGGAGSSSSAAAGSNQFTLPAASRSAWRDAVSAAAATVAADVAAVQDATATPHADAVLAVAARHMPAAGSVRITGSAAAAAAVALPPAGLPPDLAAAIARRCIREMHAPLSTGAAAPAAASASASGSAATAPPTPGGKRKRPADTAGASAASSEGSASAGAGAGAGDAFGAFGVVRALRFLFRMGQPSPAPSQAPCLPPAAVAGRAVGGAAAVAALAASAGASGEPDVLRSLLACACTPMPRFKGASAASAAAATGAATAASGKKAPKAGGKAAPSSTSSTSSSSSAAAAAAPAGADLAVRRAAWDRRRAAALLLLGEGVQALPAVPEALLVDVFAAAVTRVPASVLAAAWGLLTAAAPASSAAASASSAAASSAGASSAASAVKRPRRASSTDAGSGAAGAADSASGAGAAASAAAEQAGSEPLEPASLFLTYLTACLVRSPRNDVFLETALARAPVGLAGTLLAVLSRLLTWHAATAPPPLPTVRSLQREAKVAAKAAAKASAAASSASGSGSGSASLVVPAPVRLLMPSLGQVLDWVRMVVDAHFPRLILAANAAGPAAAAALAAAASRRKGASGSAAAAGGADEEESALTPQQQLLRTLRDIASTVRTLATFGEAGAPVHGAILHLLNGGALPAPPPTEHFLELLDI